MNPTRLVSRCPLLYHMAHDGSWPSIRRHGLLSTSALLDLFGVVGPKREEIEANWRPVSVPIEHPVYGQAVIRDQLPLRPNALARCLSNGMTTNEWYRTLNTHVFFWVDEPHLETLLNARAYRDHPQTVVTLDTARLLERHLSSVRLSSINSGSVLRGGALRGLETFAPVVDFGKSRLVELCVVGAVQDAEELVVSVERRLPGGRRQLLYRSPS